MNGRFLKAFERFSFLSFDDKLPLSIHIPPVPRVVGLFLPAKLAIVNSILGQKISPMASMKFKIFAPPRRKQDLRNKNSKRCFFSSMIWRNKSYLFGVHREWFVWHVAILTTGHPLCPHRVVVQT